MGPLDTLLSSGLRASEVASLQVRDCLLGYGQASLVVRQGKGDKQREVFIPQELKGHLKAFLAWKRDQGEDVSDEATVFTGQRGPLTRNGVWRVVKGLMAAVGLDPLYPTHSCRHTFATFLYRVSGHDLEVVQEQLSHASIKTTTIYARVMKEDKLRTANVLAKRCSARRRVRTGGIRRRCLRPMRPASRSSLRPVHRPVPIGPGGSSAQPSLKGTP